MKKLKLFIRINYYLILVCFFLPFMVETCVTEDMHFQNKNFQFAKSKESKAKSEKVNSELRTLNSEPKKTQDTSHKSANYELISPKLQDTIIPKPSSLLKVYFFIVSPLKGTISGIGNIIYYTILHFVIFEPALCFLLTVISIVFIYRKKSKHLILSIISAICFLLLILLLFRWGVNISNFLIGYWLMLILYLVSIILNWISYRTIHRHLKIVNMNE